MRFPVPVRAFVGCPVPTCRDGKVAIIVNKHHTAQVECTFCNGLGQVLSVEAKMFETIYNERNKTIIAS